MPNLDFAYQGFNYNHSSSLDGTELIKDLYDSTFSTVQRTSDTLSSKIGRMAGKVTRFFRKKETKVAFIVSFWSLETIVTLLILASNVSMLGALFTLAVYMYETYALFTVLTMTMAM
jgi:hypothetical protein